jgi:BirA family biotin operon repressor/biotin-[acetyl-CoA-carboxylase] ligase
MSSLDANAIRDAIGTGAAGRLTGFEAFAEIASTNSHLMDSAAPAPGKLRVALTDNQTAGRGRHGRHWVSPAGSGLAISLAYTYARVPPQLPALTLAVGLGVVDALDDVGVSGLQLKWPNDVMAGDGKLCGILTESQMQADGAVMVVTGVGLNVDLPDELDLGSGQSVAVADIAGLVAALPSRNDLAAGLIDRLCAVFVEYEEAGFASFAERWSRRDWLRGRVLTIDTRERRVSGTAVGIHSDGALLVDTGVADVQRVTSGTIVSAGGREAQP